MENKFLTKAVNIADYHAHILEELHKGVALTTSDGIRTNSMTISWGMLGIEWNRPVFIAFVRTGRFTHELLTNNPQFTVNIPLGERSENIIRYLGTHSGHTDDKISSLGLHTIASPNVNVCGIAKLPPQRRPTTYKEHGLRYTLLGNNDYLCKTATAAVNF